MELCPRASTGAKTVLSALFVLAFGVALVAAPTPARAYDFSIGDVDIAFDSTLTFGVQVRTQSPDSKNYCTTIGGPNFQALSLLDPSQPNPVPLGAANGPGANGDCGKSAGNLNYEKGDVTSANVKGVHELDVAWKNYSGLVRFNWWYDGVNQHMDRARTPLTDDAKFRVSAGAELLDAYVQGNWYPADMPLTIKLGNQVVSWGESTFIQNGINVVNAIDVRRLRVPGAELREALIPAPISWASFSPTEWLSLEAFYQWWWWKPTILDPPGTFFSTHDALGPGGQWFDISQGHHDCDINPTALAPNPVPPPAALEVPVGLRQDGTTGATCIRRGDDVEARNHGQYGFAARFFVPQLNSAEVGLFYLNLHNRLPIVSGSFQEDFFSAGARIFGGAFNPANPTMFGAAAGAVIASTRSVQAYPEDTKKVGASFSTAIDAISTALQGEFAYTIDQPLQISEIELLQGLFASALIPTAAPKPGTPLVGVGEFSLGASKKDVVTAQATATYVGEPGQIIGGIFKASQFIFVAEMGYMRIVDFDDTNHLPLQSAVTPQEVNQTNYALGNTRDQPTSFATRNSMGYVFRAALPYNNLFWGINFTPYLGFQHDFWGYSPAPILNFVEGRKAINFGVRADYLNAWSANIGYTNFFGGDINNPINDRDFFAFDIKYSF